MVYSQQAHMHSVCITQKTHTTFNTIAAGCPLIQRVVNKCISANVLHGLMPFSIMTVKERDYAHFTSVA